MKIPYSPSKSILPVRRKNATASSAPVSYFMILRILAYETYHITYKHLSSSSRNEDNVVSIHNDVKKCR